jgi:hypothetical protein
MADWMLWELQDVVRCMKNEYFVAVIGVGLAAVAEIYSVVRGMLFRAMMRSEGFNGGFNATGGGPGAGFSGARQFGGGFGPSNYLILIGLIVAIVGVVWLGLALRKTSAK